MAKFGQQQGDVLFFKGSKIPEGAKKLPHFIVAEGETTGHAHRVKFGEAELFENNDQLYLRVTSEFAVVTHEEHKAKVIPQGEYTIGIVQEYDHFLEEARKARD